ncbi:MAG: PAS domain S-box protein [Candidatus Omnitrophica bacterium]|nr:PAS domain S-box protein [Candidatus Omnitrophota bacterium]
MMELVRPRRESALIVAAVLLPAVLLGWFGYSQIHRNLTETAFERRQALAAMAARALQEKLEGLLNLAVSLSTRVRFRELISQDDWAGAIRLLESVPRDFTSVERVLIADPQGTLKADSPALPEVIGVNFAFREWYRGAVAGKGPYVSPVYKRTAKPRLNVIAVSAPIFSESKTLLGVLALQIRLETILEWSRETKVGPGGLIYFLDHKGQVAAHPRHSLEAEIADYSRHPLARSVLKGEQGAAVIYDPEKKGESVAAFASVGKFGWGVMIEQPAPEAFRARDGVLAFVLLVEGITVLVALLAALGLSASYRAVKEQEEKFRSVVETAKDAIISTWPDGRIMGWNRAAERIFGHERRQALGRPVDMILPERYRHSFKLQPASWPVEVAGLRKDGSEFPAELSASDWAAGGKKFLSFVVRDISEQKRSQEEIIKKKEELARSKTELEQLELFAFVATHDMQEPLHKILAFGNKLKQELGPEVDEAGRKNVDRIQDAARRMVEMMEQLRAYSRISTEGNPFERVDLTEIGKEVVAALGPRLAESGARIENGNLPVVQADRAQMRQLLSNLIDNAVKFRRPGVSPVVRLTSRRPAAHTVEIVVEDNGIGFDEKYLGRIFRPFQRLHTRQEYDGSGIGLAICQRIALRHRGGITARSVPGAGSKFIVTLPAESL